MVVPVRRAPTLLVAAGLVVVAVAMVLAPLAFPEPDGRYRPGLTAVLAPVPLGYAVWLALQALRPRWFLRVDGDALDLLGRRRVPLAEVTLADVSGKELHLELVDGPHGFPRGLSAPLRLSGWSGDDVLRALGERGVPLVPTGRHREVSRSGRPSCGRRDTGGP